MSSKLLTCAQAPRDRFRDPSQPERIIVALGPFLERTFRQPGSICEGVNHRESNESGKSHRRHGTVVRDSSAANITVIAPLSKAPMLLDSGKGEM